MLRKLVITLCLTLIVMSSSDSFNIQLTCEPCAISCSQANCYRIRGDGYDKQVCTENYSCPLSFNTNLTIQKCATSVNGSDCSTKLCYTGVSGQGCISDISSSLTYSCSSAYNFWFECGSCQSTSCSGDCLRYSSSLFDQNYETCLGQCPFRTYNLTIAQCPGNLDWLGKTCSCCFTFAASGLKYNATGLCTNTNNILSSSDFTNYGQIKTGQKFEKHYGVFLMLVLLAAMIIY